MRCPEVRDALVAPRPGEPPAPAVRAHLAACAACAAFADRLAAGRAALRDRHAGVVPPPGFAGRVVANLPRTDATGMLGWAALRVLPAALAVLAAVAWFGVVAAPPSPATLLAAPTPEALLAASALAPEPSPGAPR